MADPAHDLPSVSNSESRSIGYFASGGSALWRRLGRISAAAAARPPKWPAFRNFIIPGTARSRPISPCPPGVGEGSSKILPIPRHFHICARNPVIGLFLPNRDPPADPRGNRPQFRDIPRTAIIGDDVSLTPRFIAAQVSRESEILFAEIRG